MWAHGTLAEPALLKSQEGLAAGLSQYHIRIRMENWVCGVNEFSGQLFKEPSNKQLPQMSTQAVQSWWGGHVCPPQATVSL